MKTSSSVDQFKKNLENFKISNLGVNSGNFWDVSEDVLSRIEGKGYLDNKTKHNTFF